MKVAPIHLLLCASALMKLANSAGEDELDLDDDIVFTQRGPVPDPGQQPGILFHSSESSEVLALGVSRGIATTTPSPESLPFTYNESKLMLQAFTVDGRTYYKLSPRRLGQIRAILRGIFRLWEANNDQVFDSIIFGDPGSGPPVMHIFVRSGSNYTRFVYDTGRSILFFVKATKTLFSCDPQGAVCQQVQTASAQPVEPTTSSHPESSQPSTSGTAPARAEGEGTSAEGSDKTDPQKGAGSESLAPEQDVTFQYEDVTDEDETETDGEEKEEDDKDKEKKDKDKPDDDKGGDGSGSSGGAAGDAASGDGGQGGDSGPTSQDGGDGKGGQPGAHEEGPSKPGDPSKPGRSRSYSTSQGKPQQLQRRSSPFPSDGTGDEDFPQNDDHSDQGSDPTTSRAGSSPPSPKFKRKHPGYGGDSLTSKHGDGGESAEKKPKRETDDEEQKRQRRPGTKDDHDEDKGPPRYPGAPAVPQPAPSSSSHGGSPQKSFLAIPRFYHTGGLPTARPGGHPGPSGYGKHRLHPSAPAPGLQGPVKFNPGPVEDPEDEESVKKLRKKLFPADESDNKQDTGEKSEGSRREKSGPSDESSGPGGPPFNLPRIVVTPPESGSQTSPYMESQSQSDDTNRTTEARPGPGMNDSVHVDDSDATTQHDSGADGDTGRGTDQEGKDKDERSSGSKREGEGSQGATGGPEDPGTHQDVDPFKKPYPVDRHRRGEGSKSSPGSPTPPRPGRMRHSRSSSTRIQQSGREEKGPDDSKKS